MRSFCSVLWQRNLFIHYCALWGEFCNDGCRLQSQMVKHRCRVSSRTIRGRQDSVIIGSHHKHSCFLSWWNLSSTAIEPESVQCKNLLMDDLLDQCKYRNVCKICVYRMHNSKSKYFNIRNVNTRAHTRILSLLTHKPQGCHLCNGISFSESLKGRYLTLQGLVVCLLQSK